MIGKLIGIGVTGAVGILLVVLGYLVWKKERTDLLHSYHTEHIAPENRKAYCTLSGIGLLVIGISLCITAVILGVTDSAMSFLFFAAGLAAGLTMLLLAGLQYDRP